MVAKKASGPKAKAAPKKKAKAASAKAKPASAKLKLAPQKSAGATKKVSGASQKPTSKAASAAKPIKEIRPGWTSRVFGIETARLVACDAVWDGVTWQRGETFTFLYRSRRAKFFVLRNLHQWTHVSTTDAKKFYASLPEKVMDVSSAFAPRDDKPRDVAPAAIVATAPASNG